jgi:CheY-like chemotaxis protein
LVDIQLPGMDGLEFTRRVRATPEWSQLPVVALTAYAMLGDEERMLSAGCDGYVSKPIDTRTFSATVRGYLNVRMDRSADVDARTPGVAACTHKRFEYLIPEYLAERRREAEDLTEMLATGRFGDVGTIAHNLKGSGSSYGFPELTELGAQLTIVANSGDRTAAEVIVVKLLTFLEQLEPPLPATTSSSRQLTGYSASD